MLLPLLADTSRTCASVRQRLAGLRFAALRVKRRTGFFHHASHRAIERLGATRDGMLHSRQRNADGSLRDTVVVSIVANKWPAVKRHLEIKLAGD